MSDNNETLSKLIKKFNDQSQKKKAYIKAMQTIFENLDDQSMDDFIEEEINMQKTIDDQKREKDQEKKLQIIEDYFKMIESSRFKDLRKKIFSLEEKFYENAIDKFVASYKNINK